MIELSKIQKTYVTDGTKTPVLQSIDLRIDHGEFVAIMGASGAGKTTLMNILGLLDQPTNGQYLFEGEDVTGLNDKELSRIRNESIGFVFQLFHLLDRLSVTENVLLPLLYARDFPREATKNAEDLLGQVGLSHRLEYKPTALSGGQQQRVAIARALINSPSLILADEPTGNLDSVMGREILALLQQLHRDGRTIVLITHDAYVAESAQRLVVIADGKVQSDTLQTPTDFSEVA